MLASQAKRISSFCISNGIIVEQDREKYDYCYEIMLSTLLNFAAVLLIGLCTGFLAQTVCFMLVFAVLKSNAGGYHAESHLICFAETVGTFLLYRLLAAVIPAGILPYVSIVLIAFAIVTVFILAPVGTGNKPIGRRQSGQLKRDCCLIILFLGAAVFFLLFFSAAQWAFSISFAVAAVSVSLIIGKYQLAKHGPEA